MTDQGSPAPSKKLLAELPLERFTFSVAAARSALKDISLRIDADEERIDRLIRKVDIQGIPVLAHILGLTHNKEELEILGKAILRSAEICPKLDDLKKRKAVLELASSEPSWLAGTVGDHTDFETELDTITWEDLKD